VIRLLCGALCACLSVWPALAAEYTASRNGGASMGPVHYYAPAQGKKIDGLIILISDSAGWDDAAAAMAQHLTADGEAVAGLELPAYHAALAQDKNGCSYVNSELEVLARTIERDLPFDEYRPPALLGIGAGSGIVYAAVATVLPNTFAGGIGLRFDPVIDVGHKLCLPLADASQATVQSGPQGGPLRYAPVPDHETPFLFTPTAAFAAPDGGLKDFLGTMTQAHLVDTTGDDAKVVDEALKQLPRVGKGEASVDGLPLVEIPPSAGAPAGQHPLVIFYSGDGGWRDIDKKIGGYLADQGYYVVGVDSLRYLWHKKEPQQMAHDLDQLIRHYRPKSKGNGVILAGYSFGADVLPFMVNRLAPDTRAEVKLVSLLGIAQHASFEIRLQGILGASNSDGPPTLPELDKIKTIPVQCVFGASETDSVCTQKDLGPNDIRVELNGGHHFDGDYKHTADLILAADKARLSKVK
jgi:type IV secretory pathway VirJ component